MRERLIELFKQADLKASEYIRENDHMDFITTKDELAGVYADHLLANGVIVPPCKVGDTVYVKWRLHRNSNYGIYPVKAYALRWDKKKNNFRVCVEGDFEIYAYGGKYTHKYRATFACDNVGKTVFLTREEAEKALKGGAET